MRNIIVFLNGSRGVCVLEHCLKEKLDIAAIVAPMSKQDDISLQKLSKKLNFAFLPLANVNTPRSIKQLKSLQPDLFVVAGFSTIFSEELLSIPLYGAINLHAGPLPKYRGGSPLNWQLINGESTVGVSIIKLDSGIDTGPILAEAAFELTPHDTISDLHDKANAIFPNLVCEAISKIESGSTKARIQDEKDAQYWHQRNDQDGHLNFENMTALEADRKIRALTKPYPGAWAIFNDHVVRIFAACLPKLNLKGSAGRICFIQGKGPYVICSDRALLIKEYQLDNGSGLELKHGQYFS